MKRQLIEQGQRVGGPSAARQNHDLIAKQIRLLENRLDKALVKFNETLAKNKDMREQIDSLRQERVVFDGIYKKLERELRRRRRCRPSSRTPERGQGATRRRTRSRCCATRSTRRRPSSSASGAS